jgi:hypothetical protein
MELDYQAKRRQEIKQALIRYKGSRCLDCAGEFPDVCYDFDHRDVEDKKYAVSTFLANLAAQSISIEVAVERAKSEVDKCDLVCSNCHRIRTFGVSRNSIQQKRIRIQAIRRQERWAVGRAERIESTNQFVERILSS